MIGLFSHYDVEKPIAEKLSLYIAAKFSIGESPPNNKVKEYIYTIASKASQQNTLHRFFYRLR